MKTVRAVIAGGTVGLFVAFALIVLVHIFSSNLRQTHPQWYSAYFKTMCRNLLVTGLCLGMLCGQTYAVLQAQLTIARILLTQLIFATTVAAIHVLLLPVKGIPLPFWAIVGAAVGAIVVQVSPRKLDERYDLKSHDRAD